MSTRRRVDPERLRKPSKPCGLKHTARLQSWRTCREDRTKTGQVLLCCCSRRKPPQPHLAEVPTARCVDCAIIIYLYDDLYDAPIINYAVRDTRETCSAARRHFSINLSALLTIDGYLISIVVISYMPRICSSRVVDRVEPPSCIVD